MWDTATFTGRVRFLDVPEADDHTFSICTLVSNRDQYEEMLRSYRDAGFDEACEYLAIDNSRGNRYDAYAGYNAFMVAARGKYVVLTHQDVELCFDDRAVLERRLAELDAHDADWALCGNSGVSSLRRYARRITDPHGSDQAMGVLPQRVVSLDENFIIARRSANIGLSHDLAGFHLYGADLCIMADIQGYHSYVIDFHLRHLSGGTLDQSFVVSAEAIGRKYRRAFRPRWLETTVTETFLSGSRTARAAMMSRFGLWISKALARR